MCCIADRQWKGTWAGRCPSCRGIAQKMGPMCHPFAPLDCSAEAAHTFTRVHQTPGRICFHLTDTATCTDHKSWGSSEPQNLKLAAGPALTLGPPQAGPAETRGRLCSRRGRISRAVLHTPFFVPSQSPEDGSRR